LTPTQTRNKRKQADFDTNALESKQKPSTPELKNNIKRAAYFFSMTCQQNWCHLVSGKRLVSIVGVKSMKEYQKTTLSQHQISESPNNAGR
jgi:hypothetical protein